MRSPNSEIVFHNSSSHETQIWFMDGGKIRKRRTVEADLAEDGRTNMTIGPPWEVVGVGVAPVQVTDPATVRTPFIFSVNSVEVHTQKSDNDHSDSDWLSDVFDFLGIHAGPPNCNGEVLRDTIVYQPGELARAAGQSASRDYTGPQSNERCGGAPVTRVNFEVARVAAIGFLSPNP
jgi:hypothetical protein